MNYHAFLLKYGEIAIKGDNRHIFEDTLVSRVGNALESVEGDFRVRKENGRIYVECLSDYDCDEAVDALKKVFGLVAICPVVLMEDTGFEDLKAACVRFMGEEYGNIPMTFKVESRRARKNYPIMSPDINAGVGEAVLYAFDQYRVDVHKPDVQLNIEIRNKINIYSKVIRGAGGLPIGSAGRAMLLLSGGIDSPVAGYMIAKRGVKIDATYFHAPPYTSERAKEKVVALAKKLAAYTGGVRLNIVNFTDIQLMIYKECPHDQLTIIMRRYMMKIAGHFAKESGCLGLVTGSSTSEINGGGTVYYENCLADFYDYYEFHNNTSYWTDTGSLYAVNSTLNMGTSFYWDAKAAKSVVTVADSAVTLTDDSEYAIALGYTKGGQDFMTSEEMDPGAEAVSYIVKSLTGTAADQVNGYNILRLYGDSSISGGRMKLYIGERYSMSIETDAAFEQSGNAVAFTLDRTDAGNLGALYVNGELVEGAGVHAFGAVTITVVE